MPNKNNLLISKIIRHARAGTLIATSFRFIGNQIRKFLTPIISLVRIANRIFRYAMNGYSVFVSRTSIITSIFYRIFSYKYEKILIHLTYPYLFIISFTIITIIFIHDLAFSSRKAKKPIRFVNPAFCSVEVIIVNWNGASLLRQCLPSVVVAAANAQTPTSVTLVDNGSTDDSIEWTMKKFSSVKVISLPVNHGFGQGNNIAVSKSDSNIVILLNNDMLVDSNFVEPLVQALKTPGTFAATSQIMMRPEVRREETGLTTGTFTSGRFHVMHAAITSLIDLEDVVPVFWAGGGAMAVQRSAFHMLGGFQKLYAPFYWEDTDLSYRAWKMGLRAVMVPKSRVLHLHRCTTSRFSERMVKRIVRRNEYLFTWANVFDWTWLGEHLLMLPLHVVRDALEVGMMVTFGSLLTALWRIPAVLQLRSETMARFQYSDEEIIAQCFKP